MPTRAWEEKVESSKSTYLVYFGYIGTETPSELRLAGHGVPSDYVYGAEMRIAKFYFNGLLDIPSSYYHIFFFQAEDCIRHYKVTGVQTCALPICQHVHVRGQGVHRGAERAREREHVE